MIRTPCFKRTFELMLLLSCNSLSLQICAVKAPGFGENRKANLQDLATLTGGVVKGSS